jgi:hypothetical protein
MCTLGDAAHVNPVIKFLRHALQLDYGIDICRVTKGAQIENL